EIHFTYFGTVGVEDFNFPEMKNLEDALAKSRTPHRLEMFSGRHDWPPPSVASEALEWMELQAIRSGKREHDDALTEAIWQKQLQQARELEESKHTYAAYLVYAALNDSFQGLRDLSGVEKKLAELRDTR